MSIKENQIKFYKLNPTKKKEYNKKYEFKNKEKIAANKKNYRENNKQKIRTYANEYRKKRKLTDPLYKLKNSIRRNINNSLKRNGFSKNCKTKNILDCSFEFLKNHIEGLWETWMNWDNYGKYNGTERFGWDIDHIIPLATAKTEADIINLNSFSNLRPLCSYINRIVKKDRL
jgi:hypothetical protein